MENIVDAYFNDVLREIGNRDPKHHKTITLARAQMHGKEYAHVRKLVYDYFQKQGAFSPARLARDYMSMINGMRKEMMAFKLTGMYSCKSQAEANKNVYSNSVLMESYMNGLILSQVFWLQHFHITSYFSMMTDKLINRYMQHVLDIGSGHGIFSDIIKKNFRRCQIDVVDISPTSISVVRDMLGDKHVNYYVTDIMNYFPKTKYNFIILGEILEHMDNPRILLNKVYNLLDDDGGMVWITVPTNAPAIDHVYLFKNAEEVYEMIAAAGFYIIVKKEVVVEGDTQIIGLFCEKM